MAPQYSALTARKKSTHILICGLRKKILQTTDIQDKYFISARLRHNGCRPLAPSSRGVQHGRHFVLTLVTFGVWGIVWWWLIVKENDDSASFFSGFDDDYWSYLIEREQPPAALYRQRIAPPIPTMHFDA